MGTGLKSIFAVVAFFFMSATVYAQAKKTVQKVTIKTAIVCDHCRACDSCGGLLEKVLLKNKGIQMITLDEEKMTIEVIFNSKKIDLASIKAAISQLGYDADEVKANPSGYEKLDGCCKA